MRGLTRGRTAKPVTRDKILRRKRGQQQNTHFPCSAYHEQNWQPYPVDPYSAIGDDHYPLYLIGLRNRLLTTVEQVEPGVAMSLSPRIILHLRLSGNTGDTTTGRWNGIKKICQDVMEGTDYYSSCAQSSHLSTYPVHTKSGCGKSEAHINWSMVTCKMAAPVTGTTLRTTGPVPADSWQ